MNSGDSNLTWLKEVMIALLALITIGALLRYYELLVSMPATDTVSEALRERMANVEKVATALFGIFAAFVGYYSGRVPAERSAVAAHREADAARQLSAEKDQTVRRASALLAGARDRLTGRTATAAGAGTTGDIVNDIDQFLAERWSS